MPPAVRERLLQRIHERAGRRARAIQITCQDRRVVVRGESTTYYAWQLVQSACREVLGPEQWEWECHFDVRGSRSCSESSEVTGPNS